MCLPRVETEGIKEKKMEKEKEVVLNKTEFLKK